MKPDETVGCDMHCNEMVWTRMGETRGVNSVRGDENIYASPKCCLSANGLGSTPVLGYGNKAAEAQNPCP